jgi:hypothetical protein
MNEEPEKSSELADTEPAYLGFIGAPSFLIIGTYD